jgi:hypothetical protein
MPILDIEGVGKVEVGPEFLSLPADRQAAEVDAIAATIRGGMTQPAPTGPSAPRAEPGMLSDEQAAIQQIEQSGPKPDALAKRGDVLPLGRDKEGGLTVALPSFLEGPRQTIMDLIDGRRTAQQITGKEMFDLGMLLGGAPAGGAAGTGAGVARAAAERQAAPTAERALAPAAESAVAAAVPEPVPPAPAPAAPAATAAAPETPALNTATAPLPEIKTASRAFYKQAEDAGVLVNPKSYTALADDVGKVAIENRLDPSLTPDSFAALKRISELSDPRVGPVSFKTLDMVRQIASDAQGAVRPQDRNVARLMVDKIDDFIAGMAEKDVVGGDPKVASTTIVKARELWSMVKKLEEVERLVDRAQTSAPGFSSSGFENALRTEFRALAKNDSKLRKWAPDEQKAIKKIARGGPVENTARNVGRFAPTGPVSAGLGLPSLAAIGAVVGGPVGAAVLTGAGAGTTFGARKVATILTRRNVKALETLIRNGGESAAVTSKLTRARALLEALEAAGRAPAAQGAEDLRK